MGRRVLKTSRVRRTRAYRRRAKIASRTYKKHRSKRPKRPKKTKRPKRKSSRNKQAGGDALCFCGKPHRRGTHSPLCQQEIVEGNKERRIKNIQDLQDLQDYNGKKPSKCAYETLKNHLGFCNTSPECYDEWITFCARRHQDESSRKLAAGEKTSSR